MTSENTECKHKVKEERGRWQQKGKEKEKQQKLAPHGLHVICFRFSFFFFSFFALFAIPITALSANVFVGAEGAGKCVQGIQGMCVCVRVAL